MARLKEGVAGALACAVVGISAGEASAQNVTAAQSQSTDLFARERAVAVRERPHPEYEAIGLSVGAFNLFPKIQIDGEYNDNIFAVASGEQSDWIIGLRPRLDLESSWSRHRLAAFATGTFSRYQDYDSENTEDYQLGASGRLDVVRGTSLAAGADFGRFTEARTSTSSPAASVEPIEYEMGKAYAAATRVTGRLRLSARADYQTYDYKDGETLAGVVIDQDNRDRDVALVSGRIDYAVSPATAVFLHVIANDRDYDVASTPTTAARDSSGYEVLAGVNFEIGAVSRGEIAAGYISQSYDDGAYEDIDGFGVRAEFQWFPTELTTVTLSGGRTLEDAGIIGAGGYLATRVGLGVDHELRRNVILSASVDYFDDDYNGIDRNDTRLNVVVGGTYLLNRNLGVTLAARRLEQSSDGGVSGVDYTVNRLTLSLVAQF